MKRRFVLAFMAMLVVGSFATAGAQVSSGSPYILEIGHAQIPAGEVRTRINHSVSTAPSDWHKLFFTPLGRTPVAYSYRVVGSGVGILKIDRPAPAGGITFDLQVVVWEL